MIATSSNLWRDSTGQPVGVDDEAGVIRGVIVAEEGMFKTGRGRFTSESLRAIVRLMRSNPRGVRCRFRHPDVGSGRDPLGSYLGRIKNVRLDGTRVRGDLHLAPVALSEPLGGGRPLGEYLMELSGDDGGACSASLVLSVDRLTEYDARGRALRGPDGEALPDVWMPTEISGLDIVDVGDATSALLGVPSEDEDLELFAMRARHRNRLRHAAGGELELMRLRWRHKKRTFGLL